MDELTNEEQHRADNDNLRAVTDCFRDVPEGRVIWADVFRMAGDLPLPLLRTFAKAKGYDAKAFGAAVRAYRAEETMGRPIRHCADLVEAVAEQAGITITYQAMIERPASGRIQAGYTVADLANDVVSRSAELGLGYRDSLVRAEVERWKQRNRQATLTRLEGALFDPKADRCATQWAALGRALVMPGNAPLGASPDYASAVLQTAVWQIKRKLLGLPVTDHLMVILTGGQGNGKSTFLRRFMSPIAELTVQTNFSEAFDTRNLDIWNNFALVFDEMEKADRTCIDAVKNAITGTHKSARVLHTNGNATVANRATLLGAMNGTVGSVLRDPTGMRRYAPLPTGYKPGTGRRDEVDWATLETLDYGALWRSVQAEEQRPADRVKAELLLLQEAETATDPVVDYLREHFDADSADIDPTNGATVIAATDLHRDYMGVMQAHYPSHRPMNLQSFGMKLATFADEDWYPFTGKLRTRRGSVYEVKDTTAEQPSGDVIELRRAMRNANRKAFADARAKWGKRG